MDDGIFKSVFKLGCTLRGTPVLRYLEELKESQWWSMDRHRNNQLEKLNLLLRHAYENCPFYQHYFDRHGFSPDIYSFSQLKSIPPVDKHTLITNSHGITNRIKGQRLIFSKSSGATGNPLAFYRSTHWDARHRAAVLRGLDWYGVKPWMRSGLIWGVPAGRRERWKVRAGDFLLNRFRERRFDISGSTMEDFYRKLKGARYLEGYPSLIGRLARHINRNHPDEKQLSLLLVKGTSEKIQRNYQQEAVEAFGRRIRGEYGSAEAGIISFECPHGTNHVNMEHVFVEVVENEILVTNLISFSFPIIRYRLGDYVRVGDGCRCECGRESVIIDDIIGRVGENVYGRDGNVYPSMTVDYVIKAVAQKTDLVLQCQAIQKKKGHLEFNVVVRRALSGYEEKKVEGVFGSLIRSYYDHNMDYRLRFVEDIPRRGTKMLEFISDME